MGVSVECSAVVVGENVGDFVGAGVGAALVGDQVGVGAEVGSTTYQISLQRAKSMGWGEDFYAQTECQNMRGWGPSLQKTTILSALTPCDVVAALKHSFGSPRTASFLE